MHVFAGGKNRSKVYADQRQSSGNGRAKRWRIHLQSRLNHSAISTTVIAIMQYGVTTSACKHAANYKLFISQSNDTNVRYNCWLWQVHLGLDCEWFVQFAPVYDCFFQLLFVASVGLSPPKWGPLAINQAGILQAKCPFCCPANNVRLLMGQEKPVKM